jgi:hypothetical protein
MGRLDAGKAIVGGLGIVMLAIVLDRITQGIGRSGRDRAPPLVADGAGGARRPPEILKKAESAN